MTKQFEIEPLHELGTGKLHAFEITVPIDAPAGHSLTDYLIDRFATALKAKLHRTREKYGYQDEPWAKPSLVDAMREDLYRHLEKGDPLDVAAYAAFLWFHGASTIRQDSDDRICKICSGGPGNHGACLCGMEVWDSPAGTANRVAAALAKFLEAYDVFSAHGTPIHESITPTEAVEFNGILSSYRASTGGAR